MPKLETILARSSLSAAMTNPQSSKNVGPSEKEKNECDQLISALEREDWKKVAEMARDPMMVKHVSSAKVGFGGGTALHMTAYCHNFEVTKVLIDNGADMAAKDKEGYTPLHIASLSGSHDVAELLISRGAKVTASNAYGWTPLHAASVNGHTKVGQLLLDNGATPDSEANDGRSPQSIASSAQHYEMVELLNTATRKEKLARTRRRLSSEGKDKINVETSDRPQIINQHTESTKNIIEVSMKGTMDFAAASDMAATEPVAKRIKPMLAQQCSKWKNSTSPVSLVGRDSKSSPGSGCAMSPSDSPNPTSSDSQVLGNANAKNQWPSNVGQVRKGDSTPECLAVVPQTFPKLHDITPKSHGSMQIEDLLDIGQLSVESIGDMMAAFVSEGQNASTAEAFTAKIRAGVRAYRLSGRAILSPEPSPSELAITLLSEQTTVDTARKDQKVPKDVLFYSVIDFIRVSRLRISTAPIFTQSSISATPPQQTVKNE